MTHTQMLWLLAAIWASPHVSKPLGFLMWFIYAVLWGFS
jgi:hypothetical protein